MESLFNDVEMPLCDILFEMEEAGVRIDEETLLKLDADVAAKLRRLEEQIFGQAGCSFNLNSPKQLAEVLFGRLKYPVVKRTKTGFSTDEEVLTKLSVDHAVARLVLEYRQLAKLKSTYIDALPKLQDPQTRRIHSSFNQTVTETGRLSSSNPNLQNIPVKTEIGRSIRQAFVPGEGYDVILSADYSQIELRILAHLSGDPVLIRAFQEGADIHRRTAALIFGVTEADVTDAMRDNAKRVNFGIVYGISAFGLSKDLGIDVNAAQAFIAEYFLRYPRVKEYLDSQMELARANGYVTTLLGRRRLIPEINNANITLRQFAERQATNAPIQGSAADVIKVAMVTVARDLKQRGLRARLLMQVHDERVFESVSEDVGPLATLVRRGMETAADLKVALVSKIYVGRNWLDTQEFV
jgi:DNA polymerase-1